jgi:hypothetical protein
MSDTTNLHVVHECIKWNIIFFYEKEDEECYFYCSVLFKNILSGFIYTLIWRLNITKPLRGTMAAMYAHNNMASSGVRNRNAGSRVYHPVQN